MAPVTHDVPLLRLRRANREPVRARGDYVLYWMIAARRLSDNQGLQYAVGEAKRLGRPLVVLEALRCGYPHASDRLHRFVLDGMRDHARSLAGSRVLYYPYVERQAGEGRGLLAALAVNACLVVTDEYPCFFHPRMVEAAANSIDARLVTVDSNGLLPLRAVESDFTSAYHFRRYLQRELPAHLDASPQPEPLDCDGLLECAGLPPGIVTRWPAATMDERAAVSLVASLDIDHGVPPVAYRGGDAEANRVLDTFLDERLNRYATDRNEPALDGTSGLSPWLHFGHISVHRVLRELADREGWRVADVSKRSDGKKSGWWNMSQAAESFLDEIVTWRELGSNFCAHRADYAEYDSLPGWALATLADHEADPRPWSYTVDDLENARTHDALWNAAQHQLRRDGRIHNYLRMLWGKKILEWSPTAREAARVMIHLNDRWAVDGRDPNSYSGIFWCLGRYDRPWPERPVYGTVRCMTSDSTRRKYDVDSYIRRWTPE